MQFKSKFADTISEPFDTFLEAANCFLKTGGPFPPIDWGFKLHSGVIMITDDGSEALLNVTDLMATLKKCNVLLWDTHLQQNAPELSMHFLQGLHKAAQANMPHAVNQYLSMAVFRETQVI